MSQCTSSNCKHDNGKYKLECAKCKKLVYCRCTSLPTYQLQLFLTKSYRKFICWKCAEIPSYLHAISLNHHEAHLKTVIKKLEGELGDNKDDAIKSGDIYIKNFIAALKVTSTVKSASIIGLLAQDKNRPFEVVMHTEEERNRILLNLRNMKDIPEYRAISVTKDYTINERRMIKDWSGKAK